MHSESFLTRHIGPRDDEIKKMLEKLDVSSIDAMINQTIPGSIKLNDPLDSPPAQSEYEYSKLIREIANKNKCFKNYIGLGFYEGIMPSVIQRNILENPSWYTPYTPYQAEISQGRLEALLNYQTMVVELTGLEVANASLLDESSAAAEAMLMAYNARSRKKVKNNANVFFVDKNIFPQTLDVLKNHAEPLGIELVIDSHKNFPFSDEVFGCLVQYPAADGAITDYKATFEKADEYEVMKIVAADIMALAILTPPGEWGADIVLGSSQRFGIPMGFGGPHAAFFAAKEKYKRSLPGRIIGVTIDEDEESALRMALQTREQHIKRERATSNICTAQALLATMAGMYAVYHGQEGIKSIAEQINKTAGAISERLVDLGYKQNNKNFFDTLSIGLPDNVSTAVIQKIAADKEVNLNYIDNKTIGISINETTLKDEANELVEIFAIAIKKKYKRIEALPGKLFFDDQHKRQTAFMEQDVFKRYRSETELMRYIKMLERKDISLTHSMIPLGSCTMKLTAAVEMLPLSWPEFGNIHPFAPIEQAEGYFELMYDLEKYLKEITGFDAISFQPNSGATGEYTGLMVIRQYHKYRGATGRNIVLIPSSAHGTNPASAVMAGMTVKIVDCDEKGNINTESLKALAEQYSDSLAAFMVTYPSTHGVFEKDIVDMINVIHDNGGLVYMDGANLNALLGLVKPAQIGADVCHLNLHKTFAIPHGGGGPGMGPIGVAAHLVEYLPTHPVAQTGGKNGIHAVSGCPWGSPSILPVSHAFCKMLGAEGLKHVAQMAILNANYIASVLKEHYDVLYTGEKGRVAHEMILDCRKFKEIAGISEIDIAKRLIDYGFHAPTVSFPVHGTLMVEPTESESLKELDRFIEAMVSIRKEIDAIADNKSDKEDNPLKNAPHTAKMLLGDDWGHDYSRAKAAYPLEWIIENKYWPPVRRVNDAYGDRNLVCCCKPIEQSRDI